MIRAIFASVALAMILGGTLCFIPDVGATTQGNHQGSNGVGHVANNSVDAPLGHIDSHRGSGNGNGQGNGYSYGHMPTSTVPPSTTTTVKPKPTVPCKTTTTTVPPSTSTSTTTTVKPTSTTTTELLPVLIPPISTVLEYPTTTIPAVRLVSASTPTGQLAYTGSNDIWGALVGVGTLLVGVILSLFARRRRLV